jgi:hypothetical protein
MIDFRCDICGNTDPTHWQSCKHSNCYNRLVNGHQARGRPIDDGEFGCHYLTQKTNDSVEQRIIRVDMSLAKQLQRSLERNFKLVEQNRKLKVLAETLTSALVPFKSTEMGNLLVDIRPHERMRHLIDMVDKVLGQADKMLSDVSDLQT